MENHILSIDDATGKKRYTSQFVRSPQGWAIKVAIKFAHQVKNLLNGEMLTWLSALSTPSIYPTCMAMVGLQLFTLGIKFAAFSVLLLQLLVKEMNRNRFHHNQPQVEVNSIILDISRGVLIQKSTTHQFFKETHDVLIDRVIIRTCFDAFSCAFQKRKEAKDHTLTSKTTQKKYAKQHDFFTTSMAWDFFLSWRPKKKKRRQHLDDKTVIHIPPLQKLPWSVEVEPFFLSIRDATNQVHQNLRHIGCTFHVHFITSRFEQNTW